MCQRSGIQKYLEFAAAAAAAAAAADAAAAAAAVTAPRDVIMKKQNLTRISYCVSVLDSRFWGYLGKVGVFGFAFW